MTKMEAESKYSTMKIPSKEEEKSQTSRFSSYGLDYIIISILDCWITLFIIFPLALMYFAGTWDTLGCYILPGRGIISEWTIFSVGISQIILVSLKPYIISLKEKSPCHGHAKTIGYWVITRIWMYIYGILHIAYWHGIAVLSYYLGKGLYVNLGILFASYLILCLLRVSKAVLWPPFHLLMDNEQNFKLRSRHGPEHQHSSYLSYALDALVSQMLPLTLAIICWTGTLSLLDTLILTRGPDQNLLLVVASAGMAGCAFIISIQVPLCAVSRYLQDRLILRLLWEDTVYFIVFVTMAVLWHASWNLTKTYLSPDVCLSGWVKHGASTVILISMGCFSTIVYCGVALDGTDADGDAFFPTAYLRILFKKKKSEAPSDKDKLIQQ